MSGAALEVLGITLRREGRNLVDGVSFAVPRGAFVSIIGPNGAGKSTLLRVLCGLLPTDAGEVLLGGAPLRQQSRRAIAHRIAYVPQTPPHGIPYTVGEYVAMARYVHNSRIGGLDAAGVAAVAEALELTECAALRDRVMHTLSGGEARKVHLAAALAQGGDILLLDEPTTHLDYRHQREVVRLLQQAHAARGLTIVAVQHDLNQGVLTSDVVLALKEGKVFFDGAPAALLESGGLETLFDTPFAVLPLPGGATHVAARHD
jgi:iron complex transport system ATP-binding protein